MSRIHFHETLKSFQWSISRYFKPLENKLYLLSHFLNLCLNHKEGALLCPFDEEREFLQ